MTKSLNGLQLAWISNLDDFYFKKENIIKLLIESHFLTGMARWGQTTMELYFCVNLIVDNGVFLSNYSGFE